MEQQTGLYVAGQWQRGETEIENRNPSDLADVIGHYAQATVAQVDQAIAEAQGPTIMVGRWDPEAP